jgi:hypothetical protein
MNNHASVVQWPRMQPSQIAEAQFDEIRVSICSQIGNLLVNSENVLRQ